MKQEAIEKRKSRAERFNLSDAGPELEYKPDEDIAAKTFRAQKFGMDYAPEEAVLMDMDLFEERREAARDVRRREEAVYLYGRICHGFQMKNISS
jgi:hypothetical protein